MILTAVLLRERRQRPRGKQGNKAFSERPHGEGERQRIAGREGAGLLTDDDGVAQPLPGATVLGHNCGLPRNAHLRRAHDRRVVRTAAREGDVRFAEGHQPLARIVRRRLGGCHGAVELAEGFVAQRAHQRIGRAHV